MIMISDVFPMLFLSALLFIPFVKSGGKLFQKKKKTLVWYYLSLFASEAADKEKNIPRHVLQQHLGGWNVKDTDVQW